MTLGVFPHPESNEVAGPDQQSTGEKPTFGDLIIRALLPEKLVNLLPAHILRSILRFLAVITMPIFVAQSVAFVSFVYEEALQSHSMAIMMSFQGRDPTITFAEVEQFEKLLRQAQRWQKDWGKYAFWVNDAYIAYFGQAAPAQIMGFYARGVREGFWREDITRYEPIRNEHDQVTNFVDTWKMTPMSKLAAHGFMPERIDVPPDMD
jgi:hypothetical protein